MRKNQTLDLSNLNIMAYGLHVQSMSLYLAQKSMEDLIVFKPHLKPLLDEVKLLDKAIDSLEKTCNK